MREVKMKDAGGRFDIWADGWHVHVPAHGDPDIERGDAPADADAAKDEVVGGVGDKTFVKAGDWFIVFRDPPKEGEQPRPTYHRTDPEEGDPGVFRRALNLTLPE